MILNFSKDLDRVDILANGSELVTILAKDIDARGGRVYDHQDEVTEPVATIYNPVLITDYYQISTFNSTVRDTIFALYASPKRITVYGRFSFSFEQGKYPYVWGPSIDTLLLAKSIDMVNTRNTKSAIEIGTGSGFLSKFLLDTSEGLEEMHIVDIHNLAIQSARDQISDERAIFYHGNGMEYMKGKKFDLLVCNPPYIPRPKSIDDNPYEGVSLMVDLIKKRREYLNTGGKLVINISSVGDHIVTPILEKIQDNIEILEEREVPLKVFNVINNKDWIEYLTKNKGLTVENKNGYDYWQTLRVICITV